MDGIIQVKIDLIFMMVPLGEKEQMKVDGTVVHITGWTDVNHLYFSDSIEIASSLEGLTLWCSEINQSKRPLSW